MARHFTKTSSAFMVAATNRTVPLSLSFWGKTTDFTNTNCLAAWENPTNQSEHYMLLRGATTKKLTASDNLISPPAFGEASSVATPPSATWFHCCAIWASATDRRIWLNNVLATDATSVNVPTVVNFNLGRLGAGTNFYDGDMAEVAFWDVALTAADVKTLSLGFSPYHVRPQNLLGAHGQYWNFYKNGLNNAVSRMGSTLTNNGTFGSDHPRIYP